jgi:hypothetical protein
MSPGTLKLNKEKPPRFFTRLMEKFRIPSLVSFGSKINEPSPLPSDPESDFFATV